MEFVTNVHHLCTGAIYLSKACSATAEVVWYGVEKNPKGIAVAKTISPKALYHLAVIFESFHLKMGTE